MKIKSTVSIFNGRQLKCWLEIFCFYEVIIEVKHYFWAPNLTIKEMETNLPPSKKNAMNISGDLSLELLLDILITSWHSLDVTIKLNLESEPVTSWPELAIMKPEKMHRENIAKTWVWASFLVLGKGRRCAFVSVSSQNARSSSCYPTDEPAGFYPCLSHPSLLMNATIET